MAGRRAPARGDGVFDVRDMGGERVMVVPVVVRAMYYIFRTRANSLACLDPASAFTLPAI